MSTMSETKQRQRSGDLTFGIAHIRATHNNTFVTITDAFGDTLCWASAGACGFKGARKSTSFAGQCAAQKAADKAIKLGVQEVELRTEGRGPGLEGAVAALESSGLSLK